jgi:hypothetical protein
MTTASTTTVINHGTLAGYNAWVTEVITALFTSVGLTQTSDTGQTTNGGSSVPAVNTAGGYVIGRFNDTAQSTSPVFFKLEFGTASSSGVPQMWITIGQGSNGSGTLTGTLSVRTPALYASTLTSSTTSYVSRYCWNATAGFFGMVFKIGSATGVNQAAGSIFIFRDNNSSGASTTNSVTVVTSSNSTTQQTSSQGAVQTYSYLTATMLTLPSSGNSNGSWTMWPFGLTSTTFSGQVQVAPAIFCTPVLYISACLAMGLLTEIPIGNTVSMALVGSTAATFLSVGLPFGASTLIGGAQSSSANTLLMLWQ